MAEQSAREAMFARIRRAIQGSPADDARRQAVADRLHKHGRNLVPARAALGHAGQLALFRNQAEAVQASVAEAATPGDIPAAIVDYLRRHNLPQRLRHGADPLIAGLPWAEGAPHLERLTGPAEASDEASLSRAFAAVAETGTLILTSGPDNPTTLNFLPETHIVVVPKSAVTGSYEDAWERLRAEHGEGVMPRTVNMITGPSRTGDIEQKLEFGAHGPKRLHIILVGE